MQIYTALGMFVKWGFKAQTINITPDMKSQIVTTGLPLFSHVQNGVVTRDGTPLRKPTFTFKWRGDTVTETHHYGGKSELEMVAIETLNDILDNVEDFTDLAGIGRVSDKKYASFNDLAKDIIEESYTRSGRAAFDERKGSYEGADIDTDANSMAEKVISIVNFDNALDAVKKDKNVGTPRAVYKALGAQFSRKQSTIQTLNSNGKPIYSTQEGINNFWEWFNDIRFRGLVQKGGSSKDGRGNDSAGVGVSKQAYGLDPQGRPRVFYHGTASEFNAFDLEHPQRKDRGWLGDGVYLTNDPLLAQSYSNLKAGNAAPNIMPLYVALHNPYFASLKDKQSLKGASKQEISKFTDKLKALGHDGVVLEFNDETSEVVAFQPSQVKSATGNNGNFDANNNDIRFSHIQDDLIEKNAAAIAQHNDKAQDYASSTMKLARNVMAFVDGKGGVIPHKASESVGDTLAKMNGFNPTDAKELMAKGSADGVRMVDTLAAVEETPKLGIVPLVYISLTG